MTATFDGTAVPETLGDGAELILGEGRTPVLGVTGPDLPGETVRALLGRYGALLVRGLGLAAPADLGRAAQALGVTPMTEREGFTGRTDFGDGVYGASEWPADEPMCMHHERSYGDEVPGIALFGCLTAPRTGGATAVADARTVLAKLPADLVERFARDGWRLARTYRDIGVSWAESFGTQDTAEVDAYCRAHALDHEWLPDGGLRTVQHRAAVVRHPATGERLWFNQIAFLNELTMDPAVREYLVSLYGPGSLPFTTFHGDGEPVPAQVVETINEVYTAATVREPWQAGDLLVVDNLRMAHSREAYEGDREIVALFGDPVRLDGHVRPSAA
ncbi:TauD/TfdA family dioxygenase [Streptomyces nigrescens]|uniref:TauD/TfdA family dioxygenase n=1 Tax=Streptomyces nigrescens TaxID=1920 RepID=UPI003807EF84